MSDGSLPRVQLFLSDSGLENHHQHSVCGLEKEQCFWRMCRVSENYKCNFVWFYCQMLLSPSSPAFTCLFNFPDTWEDASSCIFVAIGKLCSTAYVVKWGFSWFSRVVFSAHLFVQLVPKFSLEDVSSCSTVCFLRGCIYLHLVVLVSPLLCFQISWLSRVGF